MKAGFTLRIDPIAGKAGENGLPEDVQPLAKPVQEQPLARPARREQEEAGQVETEQQKSARLKVSRKSRG